MFCSLQAFANMTTNVRRELCAVMLFAVVEHANVVVLNDGDQVWFIINLSFHLMPFLDYTKLISI